MRTGYLLWLALQTTLLARADGWIQPFPVGTVGGSRPAMGAYFSSDLDPNSLEFVIDGRSWKDFVQKQPGRWALTPNYDVDRGRHLATFSGRTRNGQTVRRDWTFTVGEVANLEFGPPLSGAGQRVGAPLSAPVRFVRLEIDGKVVPTQGADGAVFHPLAQPLSAGRHQALLLVVGLDGLVSEKSWFFQTP